MDIYKYPIEGKMDYWHTAPLHLRLLDSYIRTAELGLTFESSQIESFFFFKIFIVDKIDQFIFGSERSLWSADVVGGWVCLSVCIML